ncbi:MAG: hypothetical protein QG563_256 [Patescibacteria group bacterium]|nr:hypothetical protein [Patescibacteria group bacterium]
MKMNEWPPEPKLKEMVQIEEKSKVSADFINEYTFPRSFLDLLLSGNFDIKEQDDIDEILHSFQMIKDKGLKTYAERFPASEFQNPVNESNELIVEEIDKRMVFLKEVFDKEWTIEDIENKHDELVEAQNKMNEITLIIRNGIPYQEIKM